MRRHAKVLRELSEVMAERVGNSSLATVIYADLTALATEDSLCPYLASRWGMLADIDPEILEQLEM